jgi:hypothetical protein
MASDGNSAARQLAVIVSSRSYTALREATREREEREVERRRTREARRAPRLMGLIVLCIHLMAPFYIVGRGCPYPSTRHTIAVAKGRSKAVIHLKRIYNF